jgi:hypothetical protein
VDVYLEPGQQRHRRQVLGVMPAVRPHYFSAPISRRQAEVDQKPRGITLKITSSSTINSTSPKPPLGP